MLGFNFWDYFSGVFWKYPGGVVAIFVTPFLIRHFIKNKLILSTLVTIIYFIVLFLVTFTEILKPFLENIPIVVGYIGAIFATILMCIVYDYETFKNW
ncbi:hypothetical protein [Bacillus mycoides]|uniref:hypothetical protein n=1 Tax=Bacillus mycoides TaxID=1405 RepID=UPI001C030EF0|nr:hypothetical protein [Bacillus mycoides]MED1383879.1 hypothetical protein [Bacillus mycoides]QWI47208.1 hypothetical protein EXW55_30690 [Bacillus mycoides]